MAGESEPKMSSGELMRPMKHQVTEGRKKINEFTKNHRRGATGLVHHRRRPNAMKQERWLRIIPVALVMYTISYVDRTNVSLALDPAHSTMMSDLHMDDQMKGEA